MVILREFVAAAANHRIAWRSYTLRDYLCNEVISDNECEDFSQWFFTGEEEEEEEEDEAGTVEEEIESHDEL